MQRTLAALAAAIALCAATPSHAGFVDLFNGVKVGTALPAHEIRQVAGPVPDAAAKLRLIDFWSTTCAPCRTSIPQLNALHDRYAARGLALIGVSEEAADKVLPFLEKLPMRYAVAVEADPAAPTSLHKSLRIRALPYAIFVDRGGTIVWRGQPEQIDAALVEKLLERQAGAGAAYTATQ